MNYLNTQGIYPGVHYRDNTHYTMYEYALGTCPFSQTISEKVISLPLHLKLTNDDVKYIIDKTIETISKLS
jgi:dTDP-4-amino-4,6-dideoxygalactose transaminase